MHEYQAKTIRVLDGDTVELDIDLGLHVHVHRIARLIGINTPEIRGDEWEAGERAKRRLVELTHDQDLICVTTLDRDDKYGRILVDLWDQDHVTHINRQLVIEGLAVEYRP